MFFLLYHLHCKSPGLSLLCCNMRKWNLNWCFLNFLAFFGQEKSLVQKLSTSQESETITVEAKVMGQGSGALPSFLSPG